MIVLKEVAVEDVEDFAGGKFYSVKLVVDNLTFKELEEMHNMLGLDVNLLTKMELLK